MLILDCPTVGVDVGARDGLYKIVRRKWLAFDRVITAINGNKMTVNAPIVCAIEQKWGNGSIARYDDPDRIEQCGVENLRAVSKFNRSKTEQQNSKPYYSNEDHTTYLVAFDNVKNC